MLSGPVESGAVRVRNQFYPTAAGMYIVAKIRLNSRNRWRSRRLNITTLNSMTAMEPLNTHEQPLYHAEVEEWQNLSTAEVGDGDSTPVNVGGTPVSDPTTTATAELGSIAGVDYGLWEMSAGAMRDIEGDEVFLVISGTGRIEFDEPLRDSIELVPGSLVRLEAGMKTRWYVTGSPLRKLFITPSEE